MAGDITDYGPAWSLESVDIGIPSGSSITWNALFYAREVQVNPNITTLQFEGDDTVQVIDEPTLYDLTINCDKQDPDSVQAIFGKTKVTGIEGVDWAMYFNDDSEIGGVAAALRYTLKYKDESVTPNVTTKLRYYWFKGILRVVRPQTATWKAKFPFVLNASFEKTETDVAGVALVEVPDGGAPFRVEKLTVV